ncbi:ATP-binding protein [Sagittula sp. SSi028]|uniref:ATP-binding protein n=1 Tax=Sagittula sp. SSi028 TaxID=3400636 RepID=UPI003AF85C59
MSFRLKTVLGITLIQMTVLAVLVMLNYVSLASATSRHFYERAETMGHIFGHAIAGALATQDLYTIDAAMESAMLAEDMAYARIRDHTGRILSTAGDPASLAQDRKHDASFDDALQDHYLDIVHPILENGAYLGTVELGLSTARIEAHLLTALRRSLTLALLGGVLAAGFGYGLGTLLTRQTRDLREGARALTAGNLSHRVPVYGKDELAEAAVSFNEMAEATTAAIDEIKRQRDTALERKARIGVILTYMSAIASGKEIAHIPDTEREDEIGDLARATVVLRQAMETAEKAHREQNHLIQAFNQVNEQVAIFDTHGQVIFVNSAFRQANAPVLSALPDRFTREDFLRKGCELGHFGNIEDIDAWVEAQSYTRTGAPREFRNNVGQILLISHTWIEDVGLVVSAKDVTELRKSEHQLLQSSKMATLGEMATGIAHELNQPLGVIRMAASNSIKRIDRDMAEPDKLREKFVRVAEQTERAAQIINQLRVFGRKANGRRELIDLNASLSEIAALARMQLHTLDIALTVDHPSETGFCLGEKVLFEQVLLNLISNAADAIEQSQAENRSIHVLAAYSAEDGQNRITVTDTGTGIPEHVLDKLFDPFFTTKDPGKGTGLGLSISFSTIRDMGGQISATNTQSGACFQITLPSAKDERNTLAS